MNEIEKMYKNAEVEKYCSTYQTNKQCESIVDCSECASAGYPPFTAEKQLKIIKFLGKIRDFHTCGRYCTALNSEGDSVESLQDKFEESLAGLMNLLWKNLTSEEKQQIKDILK